MGLTADQVIVILVSYGLTFLLCLNVGSSALGYFVSLYRPSPETLNAFLDGLRFPFDIFASSRERTLTNLLAAERNQEQRRRIIYSVVALSVHLLAFIFFAGVTDGWQALASALWMALYLVTHFRMWRFGSGLKPV